MGFELNLMATYFLVPVLAVLWKYSGLPKLDWTNLVRGTVLLFGAEFINQFAAMLTNYAPLDTYVMYIAMIVQAVGLLLVIYGTLQNVYSGIKK